MGARGARMGSRTLLQGLRHAVVMCVLIGYAAAGAAGAADSANGTAAVTATSTTTSTTSSTSTTTAAAAAASLTAAADMRASNDAEPESGAVPVNTRNAEKTNMLTLCPNMVHNVFEAAPHDGAAAGIFEEYEPAAANGASGEDVDLRDCLAACCAKGRNGTCNVVFAYKRKCYHVRCVSNAACLPKQRGGVKARLQMILVNPVRQKVANGDGGGDGDGDGDDENVSWLDVLKETKSGMELLSLDDLNPENSNSLSFWKQSHKFHYPRNQDTPAYEDDEDFPIAEKRVNQLLMSSMDSGDSITPEDIDFYNANIDAVPKFVTCNLDVPSMASRCPKKEECAPVRANSATGICKCIGGYVRNAMRVCVPQELDYPLLEEAAAAAVASEVLAANENGKEGMAPLAGEMTTAKAEPQQLQVTVASKEVRLPEKEVTLAAIALPDEAASASHYKYLWTLITQPKGPMNGTISDQSNSKVKLSNLSEGLYTFKVSVTGENGSYGEAMANVSVLPESRVNRLPQAVIVPAEHSIRLPTTNAILDGSTSTDDDKIVSWHWEVVSGPIGYQPQLPDVNTLHLTDLTAPGNYTFKLTVSDSNDMTNSTTANITVLKATDYAPVANAGDAVILYMPNNNVTLNGTASSDDHEIVAWEWTKDASVEDKAVDMQNTRTPYVELSNLEQGMYTFVLKVTDSSGQSSTAKVQVCVKPPTNTPPIAVAGAGNVTVNLPLNWVLLNGSQSHDDIHIQSFRWRQLSGPNTAAIVGANESIANATSLTLGLYEFQLTVQDDDNNTANDTTWVKIIQEKNAPPVAHGGSDQSITLPVPALYLNGSQSSDDLAVVKYAWTRDDTSLAGGVVVGDSASQPVLILTELVHGHYVFKLTVSDEQGLTGTDVVNVVVRPDPLLMKLVQLTLPIPLSAFTQAELNSVIQKLGLLLNDMKIHMRDLKSDTRTNATILVFYVESVDSAGAPEPVDGLTVEQILKDKIQRDASILGTVRAADVRTTICQNKCSHHGECNVETRACICEAFWMPSVTYYWGFDEANCDWSILYVFVGVLATFLLLSGICWGLALACKQTQKKPRSRPKVQKYSLLGTQDEEAAHVCRKTSLTDSETDSDVLFETRTKPNGLRANGTLKSKPHGHHRPGRYSHTKLSRKVKT